MLEKTIKNAVMHLLRSGLWGEKPLDGVFPLTPAQWTDVYQCAQRHTVEGIVFDGIQGLSPEQMPPRDLLMKWTVRLDQIERRNRNMNACIAEQVKFFASHNLHPTLLKGQGVAACYKVSDHRVCGDIDWYFDQMADYRKAAGLLGQKGIELSYTAGFSVEYAWRNMVAEHHQRMFDIHNPFSFRFLGRLERQFFDRRLQKEIQGARVYLPAPLLMALQVNVHILKHLLSFGVGLRQLCDSARVYHRYQADIDGEELRHIYKRLGILNWIHLLHAVLVKFVGLPGESLPFELPERVKADWMMEEIWISGNFGFFDSRFESEAEQDGRERSQASRRVFANLRKYVKYVPMEAICFPLVQIYSRYAGK